MQVQEQDQDGSVSAENTTDRGKRLPLYGPKQRLLSPPAQVYGELDLQMAEVCPGLFFGSQDVAYERDQMKSAGVTHIINAVSQMPDIFPNDFIYKRVEIPDSSRVDIYSHFASCNEFIDQAITAGGAVYVHCSAGISRSASICLAYLISRKKMRFRSALEHVRSIRPKARPNEGFKAQLRALESEVLGPDPICRVF